MSTCLFKLLIGHLLAYLGSGISFGGLMIRVLLQVHATNRTLPGGIAGAAFASHRANVSQLLAGMGGGLPLGILLLRGWLSLAGRSRQGGQQEEH